MRHRNLTQHSTDSAESQATSGTDLRLHFSSFANDVSVWFTKSPQYSQAMLDMVMAEHTFISELNDVSCTRHSTMLTSPAQWSQNKSLKMKRKSPKVRRASMKDQLVSVSLRMLTTKATCLPVVVSGAEETSKHGCSVHFCS